MCATSFLYLATMKQAELIEKEENKDEVVIRKYLWVVAGNHSQVTLEATYKVAQ